MCVRVGTGSNPTLSTLFPMSIPVTAYIPLLSHAFPSLNSTSACFLHLFSCASSDSFTPPTSSPLLSLSLSPLKNRPAVPQSHFAPIRHLSVHLPLVFLTPSHQLPPAAWAKRLRANSEDCSDKIPS